MYYKATIVEVNNHPVEPHVHEPSGEYTDPGQFDLSAANGLSEGDWILEGIVRKPEDGIQETTEQLSLISILRACH